MALGPATSAGSGSSSVTQATSPWVDNITQIGGVALALGQTTMSASLPVTLASDQSAIQVVGNIASGSADSGNPVKVGAIHNTTLPTFTNLQRGDLQIGTRGALRVAIFPDNSASSIAYAGDHLDGIATSSTANQLQVGNRNKVFNGTSWDRQYTVVNALDSVGTGIAAAGIVGQFDDVATGTVTENQFAPARISSRRALLMEGVTASAATDAGNPIKGAGKFNNTLPTFTDGQIGDLQIESRGALRVALYSGANQVATAADNSDVVAASSTIRNVFVAPTNRIYNATTTNWERQRTVINALDSTGTGITAAGLVGQFDDVATGTVTEDQFSTVRISSRRALLVEGVASGTAFSVNPISGQTGVQGNTGAVSATTQRVTLATDIALPTGTNAIGRVGHDTTGIGHGVTTVTTAGTDVVLTSSTACKKVVIQSQTDNTGLIAVGASGVDATVATGTGIILNPGDVIVIAIDNLNDVYIDSTVNGEGVRYTYFV